MGSNNSFKQLGQEEEERHPHPPPGTEMGVMGNVRMFNFMSNVLELYLPRVFEMFVTLVGGAAQADENGTIPTGSSRGDSDDETPAGKTK